MIFITGFQSRVESGLVSAEDVVGVRVADAHVQSSTETTCMTDITTILSKIDRGDPAAADELLPLLYEGLRGLAATDAGLFSRRSGKSQDFSIRREPCGSKTRIGS
ncbi:MAG: ECF-type sigma factor [bacterium]|nr:ECF-type sigma factor [bacterium]